MRLFDFETEQVTDVLFKQMKKYKEAYPNYIYALTMGLGKTILMATCIFYEFLLANKLVLPLLDHSSTFSAIVEAGVIG